MATLSKFCRLACQRRFVDKALRELGSSYLPKSNGRIFFSSASSRTAAAAASSNISPPEEPTFRQLRIVALRAAIPMVGFGFMDNLVMIQAGEAIDMTFGVAFGLSTLTAAGFGQCVSDVAGITCGGIVDATVAKLNLPSHNLSPAQLSLKRSRIWGTLGGCVGVVTGCLLGMFCLLFMDTDRADRAKKAKELQSIFESVLAEGHKLVGAERSTLWMLDEEQGEVWSRVASGVQGVIKAPVKGSIVGACVSRGETIIIDDAYKDTRFDHHVDDETGYHTKSVIAVPVLSDGKVIGAIQMINKIGGDDEVFPFKESDEKLLKMLASHVSTFIRLVNSA